ncbi:YtxH domain-containing protein [Paenibacillus sp. 1P03SA]|uniref:YtxH domain-containing protein n=1 Tax=Paenibacillus sp. 1P03SA TaxID=3132294 RepID=UPI0039A0B4E5
MANSTRTKDLVFGALLGSVAGAVTALLLAPKSGKELRSDIAVQAANVSEKTQAIARNVGEKTSELVGKAKEVTLSAAEGIRSFKSGESQIPGRLAADEIEASDAAPDLVILGK